MSSIPNDPREPDDKQPAGDHPSTPKQQLLEFIRQLPDDASYEELLKRTVEKLEYTREVLAMIERAEEDIEEGRTVSHEEAKARFGIE